MRHDEDTGEFTSEDASEEVSIDAASECQVEFGITLDELDYDLQDSTKRQRF